MPKDIDRVTLQVSQFGKMLLNEDHPVGEGGLLLPAEFRIAPTGNSLPVIVHGVAYRSGMARIERSAITPIPTSRTALMLLPFDYLCAGSVNTDGTTSCDDQQTCDEGSCVTSVTNAADLLDYTPASALNLSPDSGTSGNIEARCFDVMACLAPSVQVQVEPTCSFAVPSDVQQSDLNVALKLPLGHDGVCGGGACWVVLDAGSDGWTLNGSQVSLPPAVCRELPGPLSFAISYSNACGAKTSAQPPCGPWSSITVPAESPVAVASFAIGTGPKSPVGNACAGEPTETCGNCGTRTRVCGADGTWSDWGDCMNGGECVIGSTQLCGAGGTQVCSSMCEWQKCFGQLCYGSTTQACGNCGTQHRACDSDTGGWSDWGACEEQGACQPGANDTCSAGGTRACGGNCQWGACGDQACIGAPTAACGNCGTEARTCDNGSATWSSFAACTGEGVCVPNATQACGQSGTQTCGGNCRWDTTCSGQMCQGPATQACGNCGSQTRSCDGATGTWSGWSACTGGGVCTPTKTQACGAGGTQVCGDNCQWSSACTGQSCLGAMTETCGNCGVQSRTCDAASAKWSSWSACGGTGSCRPGASQACGSGGTQACGANCAWGDCTGQTCTGSASQACGNCGTQARTCNGSNGQWSAWSKCGSEGKCNPKASQKCGNGGTQACSATCEWGTCGGQSCTGPTSQSCGSCGSQTRTCTNGSWSAFGTCTDEGMCAPGTTQACGSQGKQTCDNTCKWGSACTGQMCSGSATQPCGNCGTGTQTRTCDATTGNWGDFGTCVGGGSCVPNTTQPCGTNGTETCDSTCNWSTNCVIPIKECTGSATQACGNCNTGKQTRACDATTGTWGSFGACTGGGTCAPNATQPCGANNVGKETCDSTCNWNTTCVVPVIQCTGSGTETCGNCGTATRTCDTTTGKWSDYGACAGAGACKPDSSQPCGSGGTQTCSNTCDWGTCGGQSCLGSNSQPCGNCGSQTRTCNNGTWSAFGTCTGEGVCASGTTQACGSQGKQTCDNTCKWGSACTGQMCSGSATQPCGNCGMGTQTRTCDATTGNWGNFSACVGGGTCAPNTTQPCRTNGTETCDSTCNWSTNCVIPIKECTGSASQSCGNCNTGTQTRTCDTTTGNWSNFSACSGGGTCAPNDTRACPDNNTGTETCDNTCSWSTTCVTPVMQCAGLPNQACGNCDTGSQTRTCNTKTGTWSAFGACNGDGECAPNTTRSCGANNAGTQTCGGACSWATDCVLPITVGGSGGIGATPGTPLSGSGGAGIAPSAQPRSVLP